MLFFKQTGKLGALTCCIHQDIGEALPLAMNVLPNQTSVFLRSANLIALSREGCDVVILESALLLGSMRSR